MVGKNYYDLHISSNHSFGTSSIEEIIRQAERLELHTIAIVDMVETKSELLSIKSEIASVKTPVKVLVGIELKVTDAAELQKKISEWNPLVDIIAVSGGELASNKAACENSTVTFLAHPEFKRRDSGMDNLMARAAERNLVAIELNFREFLNTYGKLRSHVLSHMSQNVALATKANAPVIVTSAAESLWHMRAGRELSSLAYLCGMTREQAVASVTITPERLLQKSRSPINVLPQAQNVALATEA